MVTGGYNCDVRLWDFAGMDSSLQSFRIRTIRLCERHINKWSQPLVGRDSHSSIVMVHFTVVDFKTVMSVSTEVSSLFTATRSAHCSTAPLETPF